MVHLYATIINYKAIFWRWCHLLSYYIYW